MQNLFKSTALLLCFSALMALGAQAQSSVFGAKKEEPNPKIQPVVELSPNPNSGRFLLKVDNPGQGEVSLSIFGKEGQAIWHHSLRQGKKSEENEFNLSDKLGNGVYPLVIRWAGGTKIMRIVVEGN